MSLLLLGAGRSSSGAGASGVSFDGVSSGVTLSNGNLTVTGTAGGSAAGGRSLTFKATGKFYFEVALDSEGPDATSSAGLGIAQSVATYTNFIGLNNLTKTAGLYTNGDVWAGGGFQDTLAGGNWTAGTVGCCAVDVGTNKIWFRKNNGAWSLAGDPASGAGSIAIQSASWAPIIAIDSARSDALTGRFLPASWSYSAPSGFGEWTP